MSNQTVTSDMTLEQVIANGLNDGENITINSGAVVTCDRKPTKLIGDITINDGKFFVDGVNISTGNSINFIGEGGDSSYDQRIIVNGQGTFEVKGDWFDIGTTDGTDSQVIDMSSATGSDLWDGDKHISLLPMIQIETGRRLTYDNMSGTVPEVGDWVYKSTDRSVMGKVHSVGTGYIVLWYLTGSLADNDEIQVRKVVDNYGPEMQVSFTADMVGADTKESGVYHEFVNCRANATSYISGFHHGVGGFVFEHTYGSTSLTLGSSAGDTGGFVPPSGCNIRVPNVMFGSAGTTDYAAGDCTNNTNGSDLWQLECSSGGTIDFNTCNFGNVYMYDATSYSFKCEYVGAQNNIGSQACATETLFNHCVICNETEFAVGTATLFGTIDCVSGAKITFCQSVSPVLNKRYINASTSIGVEVSDCIMTAPGTDNVSTNSSRLYSFYTVTDLVFKNNVAIGNNHASGDSLLVISTSPDVDVSMFMISCTQDGSQQTQEKRTVSISNSSGKFVGIEPIKSINGYGVTGDQLFYLTDVYDFKLRCLGMIDDKVDFGSADAEYVIQLVGACNNIDVARMWKDNGVSEEFITVPTTAKNITVRNCSGKYASEIQPSGADNIRFMGLHGGAGNPGGSTGWEDDYKASYGNSFHDGFQSDTTGTIACLMITPGVSANETTITAGNPKFFKDGDLDMKNGDVIEFEQSYFALGHTGFSGKYSAITGGGSWFANEWSNVTLDFQWMLKDGAWNGTWLDVRTASNWTGITGDIEKGVKLKFRFTATGTQSSMSMLLIDTTTTLADQKANLYPIDQDTVTVRVKCVTVEGSPIQGVRVYLTKDIGGSVVLSGLTDSNGIIEDTEYIYTTDEEVSGYARKASSSPYYKQGTIKGTILDTGLITTAVLVVDE